MAGSHEASDPESEAELLNDDDAFIDTAQTASSEIRSRRIRVYRRISPRFLAGDQVRRVMQGISRPLSINW